MAATQTPNYGWTQPAVGGDPTTWGTELNNDLALIDAQVFANETGVPGVGSGALWFTNTPPANWLICDGSSLSTTTYNLLFAVIGYAWGGSGANFNLPNLQGVFPLGAGAGAQIAVGLGATGGEAAHSLSWAETGAHYHNVPDPTHTHGAYQNAHNHVITTGGHAHGGVVTGLQGGLPGGPIAGGAGGNLIMGNTAAVGNLGGNTDTQAPGVGVYAAATGISTTDEQGNGAGHNTVPPFLAVNFIIRFQ